MPNPQETASALWGDPDPWVSSPLMKTGGAEIGNALMGAASNIALLPQRAFESSENLRTTGQYDPAPIMETAQYLMGGGIPAAEKGAAGIFGGQLAKGADQIKLLQAHLMEQNGAHPDEIWQLTGWGRGPGGQWRFEIPDTEARTAVMPSQPQTLGEILRNALEKKETTLDQHLSHPELYRNYPYLAKRPVSFSAGDEAAYDPGTQAMRFGTGIRLEEQLPAALHETQHAIQHIEQWPRGANFNKISKQAAEDLKKQGFSPSLPSFEEAQRHLALDRYFRHAGEVESYNVERRLPMPESERVITPPWHTQDVPSEKHILVDPFVRSREMLNALRNQ